MKIKLQKNLQKYNTFNIFSIAKKIIYIKKIEDIKYLLNEIWSNVFYILWWWSNSLFLDDFNWIVIKNEIKFKKKLGTQSDNIFLNIWSWESWISFVKWCNNKNIAWLEKLIDIPWTVWWAIVQNIWAYWVEIEKYVHEVEWYFLSDVLMFKKWDYLKLKWVECEFWYRTSIFKTKFDWKFFITNVIFNLKKFSSDYDFDLTYWWLNKVLLDGGFDISKITPKKISNIISKLRWSKLPDWKKIWTAWSFFKNPVISKKKYEELKKIYPEIKWYTKWEKIKISAWRLIDKCWLKWYLQWEVWVYEKHALVLVNYWKDTKWIEIKKLSEYIIKIVNEKFWIILEKEVIFI